VPESLPKHEWSQRKDGGLQETKADTTTTDGDREERKTALFVYIIARGRDGGGPEL